MNFLFNNSSGINIIDGIGYYEQGDYEKAADVFSKYITPGKEVPIVEPFCCDLEKKGFLKGFNPSGALAIMAQELEANEWFLAAKKFHLIKNETIKIIGNIYNRAVKENNGPLLYLIGVLYEKRLNHRERAFQAFKKSLEARHWRGVFGLQRLLPPESFKTLKIEHLPASLIPAFFSMMPTTEDSEGDVCAKLSGFFVDGKKKIFSLLKDAALFGHSESQLLYGIIERENSILGIKYVELFANKGMLLALRKCSQMSIPYEGKREGNLLESFKYAKLAASHPEASAIDFFHLAQLHGRLKNGSYEEICELYRKTYEICCKNEKARKEVLCGYKVSDEDIIFGYGQSLLLLEKYREALPFFEMSKKVNDCAAYKWVMVMLKLELTETKKEEIVEELSRLASKCFLNSIYILVDFVLMDKIVCTPETLKEYKGYLEKRILLETKKKKIAKAYYTLYHLCLKAPYLLEEGDNRTLLEIAKKSYEYNPEDQEAEFVYAQELRNSGENKEALDLLISLQQKGRFIPFNLLGVCYDCLADERAKLHPEESAVLIQKAKEYYQKEIESDGTCKGHAAFNLYALSVLKKISPLPDKELVKLLKVSAKEGDKEAMNDLAMAYVCGSFALPYNLAKAEKWSRKAIALGSEKTKFNLMHILFLKGNDVHDFEVIHLQIELQKKYPKEFNLYLELSFDALRKMREANQEAALVLLKEKISSQPVDLNCEDLLELSKENFSGEKNSPVTLETFLAKRRGQEPVEVLENPAIFPSRHQEQGAEETLDKKLARFNEEMKDLRSKKQVKFRKFLRILNQSAKFAPVSLENREGSRVHVSVGGTHSGVHRPHGPDFKGGALESMKELIEKNLNI